MNAETFYVRYLFKKANETVQATSSDGTVNDSSGSPIALGVVLFEKIPDGVYYMKETGFPTDYTNTNTYVLIVGETALGNANVLQNAMDDVFAQRTVQTADGTVVTNKYAFFLADANGLAVAASKNPSAPYLSICKEKIVL